MNRKVNIQLRINQNYSFDFEHAHGNINRKKINYKEKVIILNHATFLDF